MLAARWPHACSCSVQAAERSRRALVSCLQPAGHAACGRRVLQQVALACVTPAVTVCRRGIAFVCLTLRLAAVASLARALVSCLWPARSTLTVAVCRPQIALTLSRARGATPRHRGSLTRAWAPCLQPASSTLAASVCRQQIALVCVALRLAAVALLARATVSCLQRASSAVAVAACRFRVQDAEPRRRSGFTGSHLGLVCAAIRHHTCRRSAGSRPLLCV